MNILAPSILSADFTKLGDQIKNIENAGAQYIHFDVMDGHFVPNISFGTPVLKSVRKVTDLILDVHLMISEPEKYIEAFAEAGADIINFHIEAADNPIVLIKKIKALGKRAAITVKPNTDIENVFKYIDEVDMVLIMSVEPGFGGQTFMPDALVKAKKLRNFAVEKNINIDIEMDGGIYLGNAKEVIQSGVNVVVAGSAVFCADDVEEAVITFFSEFGR